MWKGCLIEKSSLCKRIGVVSIVASTPFLLNLALIIMFPVLMHINRTDLQNGNTVTSLKSISLSWPMRLCLSNFGMKHSCRQLILLILYLVELLVTLPPLNAFLIKSLITQPCEYLGVHAGQISDHTILTNFSSVQNNVFSLATVHSIKATSAWRSRLAESTFHAM